MRLDQWLTVHGYAATRSRARWLIETGHVRVDGQQRCKPSSAIPDRCRVEVQGDGLRYVSRGGVKLEQALRAFCLEVAGLVALDIGASTGGFTDCLLQHGARRVYALDVGTGQLAPMLRGDPRVIALEGRNLRTFKATELPEPVDLITVDVSFISLTLVLPLLPPFFRQRGGAMALVKPQFEVGADGVGRRGIVRDSGRRALAVNRVLAVAAATGFRVMQSIEALRSRAEGNQEIFVHLDWAGEHVAIAEYNPCSSIGRRE